MAITPIRTVTTDAGRTFTIRVLPTGARYGRTNTLVADAPLVEFYDVTYADDTTPGEAGHGPLGQFVSRYAVATLLGRDGYGSATGGLNLDGGVPVWTVDASSMDAVREWLTEVYPAPREPVNVRN